MEDKELLDLEEFTLEDIIREFSDHPIEEANEPEETVVLEEPEEEVPEQLPVIEEVPEEIPAVEEPVEEAPVAEEPEEKSVDASTLVFAPVSLDDEELPGEAMPSLELPGEGEATDEEDAGDMPVSTDTIRLDSAQLLKGVVHNAQPIEEEDVSQEATETSEPTEETVPFTEGWEPEYEQPMGAYVPPQPIAFQPRPDSREIKRKLVIGPEKRYYELTEKGLGGLQAAIFFTLLIVLVSAASTIAYAQGMIPENRMRLLIFGQFLAVLISALMGSNQLIQGVADLFKGRFTLNTLLVATFVACCADGVFCLLQERMPCCAAFSLEMLMSLWSSYHRRHGELGQMDVLRKAGRINGICACPEAYEGKTVIGRIPGQVEHFMDNYNQIGKPEKTQNVYALLALVFSLGIGTFTGMTVDLYLGIQMTAVSLLAAVPATAFITTTRPFAILQKRLHRLGAVLCGWQGVEQMNGKVIFPVRNEDIFPMGTTRMNGVKFFGNRSTEQILAYATALVVAEGGGLAPLFQQVLDSRNGCSYDAENVRLYDGGGIGGTVLDEPVLVGSLSFLKNMGVDIPEGIQVSQAVCVSVDGELCGVFAISYEKTKSATAGLSTLSSYRKLNPVIVAGEFMMPESFIRGKFGIKSKRLQFPNGQVRQQLNAVVPSPNAEAALLTTMDGLAPMAYGVTGARALRSACNLGVVLHIIGGILGMGIVLTMVIMNAMHILNPANIFAFQLAWLIPGLLITEWTRSI